MVAKNVIYSSEEQKRIIFQSSEKYSEVNFWSNLARNKKKYLYIYQKALILAFNISFLLQNKLSEFRTLKHTQIERTIFL